MAIAFVGSTASTAVTINYTLAWPASSVAAGRIAFVDQICKAYNEGISATPSGFTPYLDFANGSTANSADAGSVRLQTYYKILDGTESGSVSITNTCNTGLAMLRVYENATGAWLLANTTANATGRVGTGAANPGITSGDMMVSVLGMNGDLGGAVGTYALTAAGLTIGTETLRRNSITNTGFDCAIVIADHAISSGDASAAPSITWTLGQSAGPMSFVRLREDAGTATLRNLMLTGVGS